MNIAIVTDDLTSATDGLVAFAEAGWSVKVWRRMRVDIPHSSADVISIDMASRTCTPAEAIRRVTAAGSAVARAQMVVKQFDSTLRGHVVAETLGLWRAIGKRGVVVAPAFPAAGRTTVGGSQLVDGIPVHRSAYSRDALNPVLCSDLRRMFETEGGVEVGTTLADGTLVTVLDAQTESDLDGIAAQCINRTELLLAGSTGLVRALARCYGRGPNTSNRVTPESSRALIVVGSVNPQSRDQLDLLVGASVPVFTLSIDDDPSLVAREIAMSLDMAPSAALTTPITRADPLRMVEHLSRTVAQLVERREVDGLVVTGGDTMAAILDCLGTSSLTVCHELEPGVPLCVLDGSHRVPLVSKAGGFGSREVLLRALKMLVPNQIKVTV